MSRGGTVAQVEDLKVEYERTAELVPYARNAKQHTKKQVEEIANSIREFGFNDPVGVWTNAEGESEIVEGHGRVLAAQKLGMETVPVIHLDRLTDEQRRAYALAHNQTNLETGWDMSILNFELEDLNGSFDLGNFGFEMAGADDAGRGYSTATKSPSYSPSSDKVELSPNELYDLGRTKLLITNINRAQTITEEERQFLIYAAYRHIKFDYELIAQYYTMASEEVKELFIESCLVIPDYDRAIEDGWVKLDARIKDIMGEKGRGGNDE